MSGIVWGIIIILFTPLLAPLAMCFYWWVDKEAGTRYYYKHRKFSKIILILGFICSSVVLYLGIHEYLIVLPDWMGSIDEEGDFTPLRMSISILLAVLTTGFLAYKWNKDTGWPE